jgi:hypothetical protein
MLWLVRFSGYRLRRREDFCVGVRKGFANGDKKFLIMMSDKKQFRRYLQRLGLILHPPFHSSTRLLALFIRVGVSTNVKPVVDIQQPVHGIKSKPLAPQGNASGVADA